MFRFYDGMSYSFKFYSLDLLFGHLIRNEDGKIIRTTQELVWEESYCK